MNIAIKKLHSQAILPGYQTIHSAATDVAACLDEPIELRPMERCVISTGFALSLPIGYEAQIRARSGLSLKYGIALANGVATIDADYRGEIGVILINLGSQPFVVTHGMRIAQMVIARHETVEWTVVEELDSTDRGEGRYGSTGIFET